jgi:hypothetical protein
MWRERYNTLQPLTTSRKVTHCFENSLHLFLRCGTFLQEVTVKHELMPTVRLPSSCPAFFVATRTFAHSKRVCFVLSFAISSIGD